MDWIVQLHRLEYTILHIIAKYCIPARKKTGIGEIPYYGA